MVYDRSNVAHALFARAVAAFASYRARGGFAEAHCVEMAGIVAYSVDSRVKVFYYFVFAYGVNYVGHAENERRNLLAEPSVFTISPFSVIAFAEARYHFALAAS